jgi:hypothetical protein
MSDFNFGGTDDESAEIKKLNAEVVSQLHILAMVLLTVANLRCAARGP